MYGFIGFGYAGPLAAGGEPATARRCWEAAANFYRDAQAAELDGVLARLAELTDAEESLQA